MPLPQALATLKDTLLANVQNQQLSFPSPGVTSDGLNWILQNVFRAGADTIMVTAASVTETAAPSVALTATFQLFGSVSFDLTFTFTLGENDAIDTTLEAVYPSADVSAGALSLSDLLTKLNINVPVVPNLIISAVTLSASKEFFGIKNITFGNSWTVNVGASNLTISQLLLSLGYTAGSGFTGSLGGTITVDTASFNVLYTMPGDFEINGVIPSIDFQSLVNSFSTTKFTYANGFPQLVLSNAAFKINKTGTTYGILVDVADVNGWGEFEVAIQYVNQQWGFAAGFVLHHDWNLSRISAVFNPIKDISFGKSGLIISSFANTAFTFPNTDVALPKQGIIAGLNFFGNIQFPGDAKSPVGALGKLIGKQGATLEVIAQIPIAGVSNTKLAASLGGTLYIPSATSTSSFSLKNPSLFITAQPSFGVSGTLNIPVKDQVLPVDGELVVSTTEIGFNAYANTSNLKNPVGFNGVTLQGIGVSLALQIETMACALALQGVFSLGGRTAARDQVAFKFAVAPEAAYPIYLIASFAQLDLPTIYNAVMKPGSKPLPPELGSISFQKLLIYWADQNTTLPDGTPVSAGFRFNAQPATFFSFQANAAIQMDFTSGFSGNFDVVKPILIQNGNVLKITKAGDGSRGPQFAFSTIGSPYLQASVDATLFKMANTAITASVASKSLSFSMKNTINSFLDSTISLTVSAESPNYYFAFLSNVNVTINFSVPLQPVGGINLGTLQVKNTGFKGSMNCHLDKSGFNMTILGGIVWEGKSWNMPNVVVTETPSDLSDIPKRIQNQWTDKGSAIFSGIVSDMGQYLTLVRDGVLTGGDNVVKVLMGVYGKTIGEIPGILKSWNLHQNINIPVSYNGHVDKSVHGDTNQHVDTPAVHVDTNVFHVDKNTPHVDTSVFGHHGDTGGGHADTGGHTDTNQPPHGDTSVHADTNPHADTPNTHIDESVHVDV